MADRKLLYFDAYAIPEEIDSTADSVTLAGLDITNGLSISGTGINMNNDNITSTGNISFNSLTNTIAGIQNQNLVDKTATTTISGAWTYSNNISFSSGTITVAGIQNQNLVDKTANTTISGIFTYANNIVFDSGTRTIAGIQNQNLVDKTAAANISGVWNYTTGLIIPDTPAGASYAVNKTYVDNIAAGISAKPSCRVATTGSNITLSGLQTIDGITLIAGNRVLVKNQTDNTQNGVYVVASGAWSRAVDLDTWAELVSAFVFIDEGTSLSHTGWVCTADAGGTIGVTPIIWVQFSGSGSYMAGYGMNLTGNTFKVLPANIIDTNYGLVDDAGSPDQKIRVNLATSSALQFSTGALAVKSNPTFFSINGSNQLTIVNNSIGPTQIDETANYTWTGKHSFAGGKLVFPTAVDSTPVEGSTYWTNKKLYGYDNIDAQWIAIGASDIITQTAGEIINTREVVYTSGSNTVSKAIASSANSVKTVGVSIESVASASEIDIRINNIVTGYSSLTTGDTYYLSSTTSGAITNTPPSGNSEFIIAVGQALSPNDLLIGVKVLGRRKAN